MANEAFALSPLNARPSLPTDEDYAAIHEAFMETARGRWFLGEYAKRNRNADTRMVLDAVERIESSLASQRQAQAEAEARTLAEIRTQAEARAQADAHASAQSPVQAPVQEDTRPQIDLWPELSKAFTRARIEIARRLVREDNAQAFEAIRAAVETIKSVTWALRERGFDSRVCDFLEIQVNAITDGYTGLMAESSVAGETELEVLATFDALIQHVEALAKRGDAETEATEALDALEALDAVVDAVADAMGEDDGQPAMLSADASIDDVVVLPPPPETPPAAAFEAALAEAAPIETAPVETAAVEVALDPDVAFREIYGDDSDIEFVDAAPLDEPAAPAPPTEPEINKQRLYEAKLQPYRSPVADMRAQAATVADDIEIVDAVGAEPPPAPSAPAPAPVAVAVAVASVEVVAATPVAPPEQPKDKLASLGDALIANGVIQHPAARPDPLAPFRRMTQAEKIALFT